MAPSTDIGLRSYGATPPDTLCVSGIGVTIARLYQVSCGVIASQGSQTWNDTLLLQSPLHPRPFTAGTIFQEAAGRIWATTVEFETRTKAVCLERRAPKNITFEVSSFDRDEAAKKIFFGIIGRTYQFNRSTGIVTWTHGGVTEQLATIYTILQPYVPFCDKLWLPTGARSRIVFDGSKFSDAAWQAGDAVFPKLEAFRNLLDILVRKDDVWNLFEDARELAIFTGIVPETNFRAVSRQLSLSLDQVQKCFGGRVEQGFAMRPARLVPVWRADTEIAMDLAYDMFPTASR